MVEEDAKAEWVSVHPFQQTYEEALIITASNGFVAQIGC